MPSKDCGVRFREGVYGFLVYTASPRVIKAIERDFSYFKIYPEDGYLRGDLDLLYENTVLGDKLSCREEATFEKLYRDLGFEIVSSHGRIVGVWVPCLMSVEDYLVVGREGISVGLDITKQPALNRIRFKIYRGKKKYLLHKYILKAFDEYVDHLDRITFNNTRHNIHTIDRGENYYRKNKAEGSEGLIGSCCTDGSLEFYQSFMHPDSGIKVGISFDVPSEFCIKVLNSYVKDKVLGLNFSRLYMKDYSKYLKSVLESLSDKSYYRFMLMLWNTNREEYYRIDSDLHRGLAYKSIHRRKSHYSLCWYPSGVFGNINKSFSSDSAEELAEIRHFIIYVIFGVKTELVPAGLELIEFDKFILLLNKLGIRDNMKKFLTRVSEESISYRGLGLDYISRL